MNDTLLGRALSDLNLTLPSEPLFYGLTGSRMYGLEGDASDYDLMIVVREKLHRDISKVSETFDVKIVPFSAFIERYLMSSANEVDFVASHRLTFLNDSYMPIVSGLRFDHLAYGFRQEAHAIKWLRETKDARDNPHRDEKRVRTVLRNLALTLRLRRADKNGDPFDIRFTETQRELFFALVPEALARFRKMNDTDKSFGLAQELSERLEEDNG